MIVGAASSAPARPFWIIWPGNPAVPAGVGPLLAVSLRPADANVPAPCSALLAFLFPESRTGVTQAGDLEARQSM